MISHETLSIFVMLNNYFHDLAVGILFANVVLTMLLLRLLKQYKIGNALFLAAFVRFASRITWGALAFIIIGGIIRTAAYRQFEWVEAAGKGQIAALVVKHILLVGCTAAAVGFQIRMSRRYRDRGKALKECEREQIA